MRARGVVFDMDGVLADTEPLHLLSLQEILAPLGVEYTAEHNRPYIGIGESEFWVSVCERFGLPEPPATMAARRDEAMLRNIARGITPMPGAVELVRELAGRALPLAVASSSPPRQVRAIVEALGLLDAFGALVSGESPEVARGKPAPDIYIEACRAIGLPPEECLAIEDSENGARAARAAGLVVVAVPCGETLRQDFSSAHHRLDSLEAFDLGWVGGGGASS